MAQNMMRWILVAALVAGGAGVTRLGNEVRVELPNFTATEYARLARGHSPPSFDHVPSPILSAVAAGAAANGMVLNTSTDMNGNCGLDAILRNLHRLDHVNARTAPILRALHSGDRGAALHLMRLLLINWIDNNKGVEILEGVSLENLILMDPSYATFADYLARMSLNRVWIDTPMLLAASALFNIQISVLLGRGEPQLVAAPNVRSLKRAPLVSVANVNNQHFYALYPETGEDTIEDIGGMIDDVLEHGREDPLLHTLANIFDDAATPNPEETQPDAICQPCQETDALTTADNSLFNLLPLLSMWDPWSNTTPPAELLSLYHHHESDVSTCLRLRDAMKLHQTEQVDDALDKEWVYSRVKAYFNRWCSHDPKKFSKSQKIATYMSYPMVCEDLYKDCGSGGKERHTCMDAFRQHPKAIQSWRRLFYALPSADRSARLLRMFQAEVIAAHEGRQRVDALGGSGHNQRVGTLEFSMIYRLFGSRVCRNAFIILTRLPVEALVRCRSAALNNTAVNSLPASCWALKRSPKCMDIRTWLIEYSKTHGDSSPLRTEVLLPTGSKELYYAAYVAAMKARGAEIASLSYFVATWRKEAPWIKMRTPVGAFTHCGLCDYLKMMLSRVQDNSVKDLVFRRLNSHWEFQSGQRLAMNALFERAINSGGRLTVVSWDKMDQVKTMVPRIRQLSNANFYKTGERLTVALVGVHAPCLLKQPLFYTTVEDYEHGSTRGGNASRRLPVIRLIIL